ncbi:MAG: hypothetical protein WBP25_11245 [Giesbergeria sp.]
MAFDLHKLARAAEFSMSLGSLGLVRCKSLTSSPMSEARQRFKAPDTDGRELARWLLGELAMRPTVQDFKEADPIEGDSLTAEQVASVTDAELESFSENVLKKNLYLTRAHGSEELLRVEGQSACDFLAQAIVQRGKEEKAQIDRIIQSTTKPLFTESTLDSIKRSLTASNQFEDLIKQYSGTSALDSIRESIAASNQIDALGKKFAEDSALAERILSPAGHEPQIVNVPPMQFPKNPILETNQILESLTGQIEGMGPLVAQGAEVIRSMSDAIRQMQGDYVANAARSDRQTKNALLVAVLSLAVSAVGLIASSWFSYQTYADGKVAAKESKDQRKAFENLHNELMTAQHEDRLLLTKALADMKQPVPLGKK